MKNKKIIIQIISIFYFLVAGIIYGQYDGYKYSFDIKALANAKNNASKKTGNVQKHIKAIIKNADKALNQQELSVVNKPQTPGSGDKHDYLSLARYYWPDPNKPDGLPYINRDGESNPETEDYPDPSNFNKIRNAVFSLALGYYFTLDEKYAEHALKLLRTWFINPETRMNPNLNFGQIVRGIDKGRPSGLIDVREMYKVTDAIGILTTSKTFKEDDHKALLQWFSEYFNWLTTNQIGVKEADATNNHGTWYDVQALAIASLLGKKEFIIQTLEKAKEKRIAKQIEPDGKQPREYGRTRSLHYTFFNLEALFLLAGYGEKYGVDLWNYSTEDGRSIKKALEFTCPFILGEEEWTAKQITEFNVGDRYYLYLIASKKYEDENYKKIVKKLEKQRKENPLFEILYNQ